MNDLLNNPHMVNALQSLALALLMFVLTKLGQYIAARRGRRSSEAPYLIKYTAIGLFGIGLVFIWFDGFGSILTALTIVAAALTLASKEVILNFLGSFVIFWRELFTIGDRVQMGELSGDVIGKGLFFFTLLETGGKGTTGHSTGRIIKIPNALILTTPITNATRGAGYVWNEVGLTISMDSDREKGRQALLRCGEAYLQKESIDPNKVRRSFERQMIFFRKMDPIVYTSVVTGGVRLTLRYLCKARMVHESEDFITSTFLDSLEPGVLELAEIQE